jgi:hypothetical protein
MAMGQKFLALFGVCTPVRLRIADFDYISGVLTPLIAHAALTVL